MAQANVANTLVVPAQTKIAPYFDDFDESKNFHRILFRPGYAVQARELTQLQTILQNQIERFGRHIFVNGSSVIGGKLDIADIITLNVNPEYSNSAVNILDFKDKTIRLSSGSSDVLARVIQTTTGTATNPPALHIKYLTGTEFVPGDIISTVSDNVTASLVATANMSSNGTIAFLYDSIYFMQGAFVKVPAQATILSKHDRVPTVKVGLELNEDFVSESSDTSLLDPALESSNYQAPGANRYKLTLDLAARDINSEDDERFIQIARIENGVVKERVKNPTYSEIEEVFARRTYDESGNYIVSPFILRLNESLTDPANNFITTISAGKAYLYGYETEIQSELFFNVPKARDFLNKTDYDLNINYGNYVYIDNLKGNFNTGMGLVDIHCVTTNKVNTSSQSAYESTKIGTTRLRDLEFYSGGANTAQRTYEFYFVDTKFKKLSSNAGGLTVANNQIHLGNTSLISTVDDAYTGSIITITSGNAAGDIREVVSYNGATRVANVNLKFSANITPTSNYSIGFDITDVDSFYQSITYTPGVTSNAFANISLLNKDTKTYNGNTFVNEPTFTRGFFSYPKKYIKNVTNSSYVYKKVYNSIQFIAGDSSVITASTDEEFEGATASSNTASTVMENWLVIVTDKLTSSKNVGDQVPVTVVVSNSTPEQAVLSTGNTSESFIATVYAKVNAKNTTPRVKTLVLANTQNFTSDSPNASFNNSTGSNTSVYLNSGQVLIYKPSGTESESLYISDVVDAVKIYAMPEKPNANTSFAETGLDVTSRYILDIGQKPGFYDHASIKLKPGYANPKDYIVVCLRYYKNSNDTGYFSVDSYPSLNSTITEEGRNIGTGYSLIPKVAGIKLSDVIDFRPVRPNASNSESYSYTSARIPVATTDFTSDYSYYLQRWDIFVLTLDKKIQRIQGVSSENPTFPVQPDRSLLLHRMRINPYTETLRDITINSLNHRRYTMKDISNIDQRLKNVEYSVSLNSLEKRAEDILIKDADGLDRTKYGILAENFNSHLLGDTLSPDYSCAIDLNKTITSKEGLLMPKIISKEISLEVNSGNNNKNISIHDDKVLLSYTTAPAISQLTATKTSTVAEFLFADFRGSIICNPEGDIWKDTKVLPPTVISVPVPPPPPPPPAPPPPSKPTYNPPVIPGGGGGGETYTGGYRDPVVPKPESVEINRLLLLQPTDPFYGGMGLYRYDPATGLPTAGTGTSYFPNPDSQGVIKTAGFTDAAFTSWMTNAVNYSNILPYGVDLNTPKFKALLDAGYEAYFETIGRPAEVSGLVWHLSQAIDKNLTPKQLKEQIAGGKFGAGASGETSVFAAENVTYQLEPSIIYTAEKVGNKVIKTNLTYDEDIFANQYPAADSGSTTRATVTRDQTARDYIEGLYESFLGRSGSNIDEAGLQAWLGQYAAEGYTREAAAKIEQGFRDSAEYKAKNKL